MPLFKYQIEGVEAMLASPYPGKLLADEPGVGKTAQAIELVNRLAPESLLVVCPASLKLNEIREFQTWGFWGDLPEITLSNKIPESSYRVANYDILEKVLPRIAIPQMVILDESHYIKTRTSGRSKAALKLCTAVREAGGTVLLMTGTPLLNCPIELWHQLVALGWLHKGTYLDYAKKYCGYRQRTIYVKGRPRHIVDVSGATNLPELRQFLNDHGMVRRKKADVLAELPPKTYQIIELPRQKQWRSSLLQSAMGNPTVKGQVAYFKNLAAIATKTGDKKKLVESLAEARRLDGEEKVEQVIEYVRECLESEKKVVVFCHHREVHARLMAGLAAVGAVGICGNTSAAARQQAVDDFQTKDEVRVFVGQIQAAGTGITLTAASHVIFAELDWVPGQMEQCADRCHRHGQKDNVQVTYLVFEDSTDGLVASALIRKQQTLSAMFDSSTEGYGVSAEINTGINAGIDPLDVFV